MKPRKIKDDIYWVGAVDWDRRLFDDLIPLPDGTSYNAYLIQGSEKTALIDTVDPTMSHVLLSRLDELNPEHIDYVIANHAEQDHSGALPQILERYAQMQRDARRSAAGTGRPLSHGGRWRDVIAG